MNIHEATGQDEDCVYLPGRPSRLRYRIVDRCTPEAYERMLARGWRRFGRVFFRPVCVACEECRSLRVDVERFRPNRSQRRTLQRNQDLRRGLRRASVSEEHIDLYDRYHRFMAEHKGWSEKSISLLTYYRTFVDGRHDYGHELVFLEGERPVAIALVDVLPGALSAVYCYYDPERRARGLGVYSVLQQIELARALEARYLYLGYCIEDNASMRYKAKYRPHEILAGRPGDDEEPVWGGVDTAPVGKGKSRE